MIHWNKSHFIYLLFKKVITYKKRERESKRNKNLRVDFESDMIDNFFIVVFTMTATALSLMGVLGKYLNGDLLWSVVRLWCAVETNKVVRCWRSGESWFGNVIYCWYLMPSCAKNNIVAIITHFP